MNIVCASNACKNPWNGNQLHQSDSDFQSKELFEIWEYSEPVMQFRGKIENVFVYQSSADLGGDIRMFYADQLKYLIDGKFVAFYNLVPEASATDRVAIAGAELDNAQITAGVKRMMEY